MSKSNIPYCDYSWSPVVGCTPIASGCARCWAEELHTMRHKAWSTSKYLPPQYIKPFSTIQLRQDRLEQPLHWRKPRTIFVNAMSDTFHKKVTDGFIMDMWRIMGLCQQHTFLVFTKRAERMLSFCKQFADTDEDDYSFKNARGPKETRARHTCGRAMLFADMIERWGKPPDGCAYPTYDWMEGMKTWPEYLDNVHVYFSASMQAEVDEAVPILLQIPAAKRGLSLEPLLGPVELTETPIGDALSPCDQCGQTDGRSGCDCCLSILALDYVIVGCESGPNRRPCKLEWIRSIVQQCQEAGAKCYVKQMEIDGKVCTDMSKFPADLRVRDF